MAVEDLTKLFDGLTIATTRELKEEAINVAISQNITVYDALFIAAAQKMNATLYTADKKLCAKINKPIKSKLLTKKEKNQ